jgi:hypothetical protein
MVRNKVTLAIAALLTYLAFLALPVVAAPHNTFAGGALPLFSDFDGDNKLDQAELFSYGSLKSIHVSLGKFVWKYLSFDSGVLDRGRLVSDDVDSDGDEDLVWISQESPGTLVMWLGDGKGGFSRATDDTEKQLLIVLKSYQHARLIDDADDDETAYEVQLTSLPALESCSSVCRTENSERSNVEREPVYVTSPFLVTVLQRGPPSQLS